MLAENIQIYLLLLAFTTVLVWYVKFLWNRRKLYIYSRNVPGPFALPLIGAAYLLTGTPTDITEYHFKWQKKFPGIYKFWFGPNLIYAVDNPEYIQKILTSPKCMDKNFNHIISSLIGTGLLTAPFAKWRRHRKAIMPSFNQNILDSFVETFVKKSKIFSGELMKNVGRKNFDLNLLLARCTLDMFFENAMGFKMNIQTTDRHVATNFDRIMELMTHRMITIWLHMEFVWRLSPMSRELDKLVQQWQEILLPIIQRRLTEFELKREIRNSSPTAEISEGTKKGRLAFLDLILEYSDFTKDEIIEEIQVFQIAGSDTTASAMCFIFEMLGMFQDVQQKVYEEVIELVGEDRDVAASDLPNLKYMERVIKETLRLFPSIASFNRALGEDVDLGATILPAGSTAIFTPICVHRNPKYWPDPLRFDPDRFLPEEVAKRQPNTYIPFSLGPRNCVGGRYAMMSMKCMISTVIRKYKIFSDYKSVEDIKLYFNIVLRMTDGIKVSLELR